MIITREHLGTIAKSVLEFLDEKIHSLPDLKRVQGQTFLIDENTKECISIDLRPSTFGTTAYAISYILPGMGIPLEVRINEERGYSTIIVKGDFNIPGYEQFGKDSFGNIAQNKRLDLIYLPKIRSDLEELIYYQ